MQTWALIVDSFRESLDRKIFWVMAAISLIVAATMFCVGVETGKVVVLFGVWEYETEFLTSPNGIRSDIIAGIVVHFITDFVLWFVGVALAIIATAGFIPALLERGAIDVVLSKPIARWRVLIGKYLGSMVFVLVQGTFFVLLTFLVIGFRWGVWLPGYLLAIPLGVVLFSYLYCVSLWAAVFFRSTVVAVLLSIGAWVVFFGVQTTADLFETYPSWRENRQIYNAVRAARWIVPKTQDITLLAARWAGAGASVDLMPEPALDDEDADLVIRAGKVERKRMEISPVFTIGSSLLFEVFVVLLAMWRFSRTDY